MSIIDTAQNTSSHIDTLVAHGVTAVGRYYAPNAQAWKRLTRREAQALADAGIAIIAIFEEHGDPELSTDSGSHDAQLALQQATALGQPEGSAIYFAMEHLPGGYTRADVPGVLAYFQGVRHVLAGRFKVGVYSDGVVCAALLDKGLADFAWLSASRSFVGTTEFDRSRRWSLAQRRIEQDWDGLGVDTDEANGEFGAFTLAAPAAMAAARRRSPAAGAATAAVVRAEAFGGPLAAAAAPARWRLEVVRIRRDLRHNMDQARTVGTYQVYRDDIAVPGLSGFTVEREGPGDNGLVGQAEHRCIEAGRYPLVVHAGPHFHTVGYETDGSRPRPCIGVGSTDPRTDVLVHPASGYGSTIGCINLASPLADADSDFALDDSMARVIAAIDHLQQVTGTFPAVDRMIVGAELVVIDPPIDQVGNFAMRVGCQGPLVRAWQQFLVGRGIPNTVDGTFSSGTRTATIAFQQAQGLSPDGVCGPATRAAARSLGFGSSVPAIMASVAGSTAAALEHAVSLPAGATALPIPALGPGARGLMVTAWQNFLIGQQFDPGPADGTFNRETQAATREFQAAQGIKADGVAGQQTMLAAIPAGFPLMEEPDTDQTGSNFPPRPSFPSLQGTAARQALFGAFSYVAAPTTSSPEAIRITDDWVARNIVKVDIPQLKNTRIRRPPDTIKFHVKAAAQLKKLFADWEAAGLLDRIRSFDGGFEPRFKIGKAGGGDEALSNHCFGTAFDINAGDNPFGARPPLVGETGSVRELVPIANANGFFWGGHFQIVGRIDGMHFEIAVLKP